MCDSIHALLFREMKTRFGPGNFGYLWALAEPIAQVAVFAVIFTLIGRTSIADVPIALFLITGILPYSFFAKALPQLSAALDANKALLAYRQVTAIDPVLARLLIETVTFILVYIIITLAMAWLGFSVIPDDPFLLIVASGLLVCLTLGLGLIVSTIASYLASTSKILSMLMKPMFFISGIFYSATMVPESYWYLFSWNPIFHVLELSRDAYFASYETPVGSFGYLAMLSLCVLSAGLALFHLNRARFITS